MRATRPQDRVRPQEPVRCTCEGGADRAQEHAKPGKKAADHGNPFMHRGGCMHSQLSATTKPRPKEITVMRIRL